MKCKQCNNNGVIYIPRIVIRARLNGKPQEYDVGWYDVCRCQKIKKTPIVRWARRFGITDLIRPRTCNPGRAIAC